MQTSKERLAKNVTSAGILNVGETVSRKKMEYSAKLAVQFVTIAAVFALIGAACALALAANGELIPPEVFADWVLSWAEPLFAIIGLAWCVSCVFELGAGD